MPAVPGMPAPLKALCVVPFGMEEGARARRFPIGDFGLVVGEPAEFRFLSSTIRKTDAVGALIEDWGDELEELSPLEVTLPVEGRRSRCRRSRSPSRAGSPKSAPWSSGVSSAAPGPARAEPARWKLELNIRERDS